MSNNIINRVKARQASFNLPVNQEVTRHADGSGGPISINKQTSNQDEYKAENKGKRSWYDTFSDIGHTVLDAAGMVPIFGAAADLANAGWYAGEGYAQSKGYLDETGAGENWKMNAAMSGIAAIPGAGQYATAAKYGKKGWDAVKFSAKHAPKSTIADVLFGGYNVYNQSKNIIEEGFPSSDTSSDTSNNTYLDNLNKNNASNTNTTTDNKYKNNQRTSNRVSQGTKSWSKGYSDWKGKGNTGSMEDFKTQANTWWDSDAGQRHAKSKGVKHRIKSV